MVTTAFIDWVPKLEAFNIFGYSVRWYSLCWLVGILFAYLIVQKLYKQQKIEDEKFDPLLFYCFIGILIGARLGHCLFYEPDYYLTSFTHFIEMILPIRLLPDGWKFEGYLGLASHGGTIGLFVALVFYVRKTGINFLRVLDNIAIATPMTACMIRLGNLMNSEIIGTPTDVPWAFIFHTYDAMVDGMLVPRHPAQLYEAIAYFVIFIIGAVIYMKHREKVGTGFFFGFCLATIVTFRFFVEFLKKEQVDFEQGMLLDMGQILSIPFVIIGIYCMIGSPLLRRFADSKKD